MNYFIGTMLVLSFIANIVLTVVVIKSWMSKTAETARIEKQAQADADAKKQTYIDSLVKEIASLKSENLSLSQANNDLHVDIKALRDASVTATKIADFKESLKPENIGANLGKAVNGFKSIGGGFKKCVESFKTTQGGVS